MALFQIIILAIVQGLTEFLPISSSAHLILPAKIFGWADQGLVFDVAVHLGSLLAVVWYFRQDIIRITIAWFAALANKSKQSEDSLMGWCIIIGTIPAVIAGALLKDFIDLVIRENAIFVIATTTVVFGLLLWWADAHAERVPGDAPMTLKRSIYVGLAQVFALIPGTSRSGVTMTAGLFLNFSRSMTAKFSFYLSIPTILGAGVFVTKDLVEQSEPVAWLDLALGTGLSFISAYACIYLFLKVIDRIGFLPFVIYRLALGVALFVIGYMLM